MPLANSLKHDRVKYNSVGGEQGRQSPGMIVSSGIQNARLWSTAMLKQPLVNSVNDRCQARDTDTIQTAIGC